MVETHDLTKIYERSQGWRRRPLAQPITAVADITLHVRRGELFGLLGPNGAGKTTLVKMLCTLVLPSRGRAVVAGHPLKEAGAIRAAVGLVVSDERSFYWRLSARRNLDFFAAMHGLHGRSARRRIDQVLTDVDLLDVADRRFSHFSSGMRQRLSIARSLLHQPRILFLDEPSRSLDPVATQRLHDLIRHLRRSREMTVFLITHDLAEAEKLCDRVALLHQGRLQAVGHPDELRRRLRPQRRYTLQTGVVDTAVLTRLHALLPDLTRTQPDPDTTLLSFRTGEEDGMLTAVIDQLRREGVMIENVTAVPPTLEEVFTHFTRDPAP